MAGEKRLHVVTGKGGTGKSTVAAALALGLAAEGKTVLLCEVEGRQGIAQLFDVPPLPYEERQVAATDDGAVYALAIDAESALLEYLAMFYRLGRAGKALDRFGVIDFATTIAPGVRDVLLTGKVYEAVRRREDDDSYTYDAVVLDAPPTGRITRFLNVNEEVAGLAKAGPVRRQADSIMTMMRSRRTAVHLVTLLEEMPVQETMDAINELTDAGLGAGHVVVNQVLPSPLSDAAAERIASGALTSTAVAKSLARVDVEVEPQAAEALLSEGREHVARQRLQAHQRAVLLEAGSPVVELPHLEDGVDLGGLYALGRRLVEGGVR
ncbi:P-loop NTPase [Mumia sp. zg.B21]|uniref:ArsA family ATPase n=1 Tax=Mumia sp. zg.B21 TaxID=2855447 RepID=UPI001C6E1E28|nr:ArsA-related P-loop ATPase [Mumia sp. zg.B21]MBW9210221.1 P-loop NTPase [Mumia sp. zg.B21]